MLKYKERVTVRLTSAQLQILRQIAKDQNKSISIVLREMVTKALDDEEL